LQLYPSITYTIIEPIFYYLLFVKAWALMVLEIVIDGVLLFWGVEIAAPFLINSESKIILHYKVTSHIST
jgi:hypothetical protein